MSANPLIPAGIMSSKFDDCMQERAWFPGYSNRLESSELCLQASYPCSAIVQYDRFRPCCRVMLSASGNHYLLSSGSWGTASNSSIESDGTGSHNGGAGKNCKEVKVVLVGKASVGKSGQREMTMIIITTIIVPLLSIALVVRFMTGRFLHCYNPTLGEQYNIIIIIIIIIIIDLY